MQILTMKRMKIVVMEPTFSSGASLTPGNPDLKGALFLILTNQSN
jgi:hypothetical protein